MITIELDDDLCRMLAEDFANLAKHFAMAAATGKAPQTTQQTAEAPAPTTAEVPKTAPQRVAPAEVKECLDDTRRRILAQAEAEGRGNRDQTNSLLNALFIRMAATLEADTKPTRLKSDDNRAAFIQQCLHITLGADGPEIKAPF